MTNPFDKFDIIYYINLDKRLDRNESILKELNKMNVNSNKIVRISGVIDKFGALGCSKSHLQCLEHCKQNNYKNCLILEDDFVFKHDQPTTYNLLQEFWDHNIDWELLMFSSFVRRHEETNFSFLIKVIEGQTTAGYAVNQKFLDKLINNFRESISNLEKSNKSVCEFCIDDYWKRLQAPSKWYILNPRIGFQKEDYSDIEQRKVNYLDKEDFKTTINPEYFLAIMCCKNRLNDTKEQKKSLVDIRNYNMVYYYFIGDPSLQTDFEVNEIEKIITLKCQDDYFNLPNKTYKIMRTIKKLFPNIKGVFKTDDDININLKNLYSIIENNSNLPYWGNKVDIKDHNSNYIRDRKEHYIQDYPLLQNYNIRMNKCIYCSGGGYYLSMNCVNIILNNENMFNNIIKNNNDLKKYLKNGVLNIFIFEDYTVGYCLYQNNIKGVHIDIKLGVNWEDM